ncbi:MAG: alanine racemase [Candidatus Pacebacteria bacterium]|nr:alanine racemase [Candidatus Paceibacterota bacterium]
MYLLNVLRRIKKSFSQPDDCLLRIHIHRDQLLRNISIFKKHFPHHLLAPVLKSNAYGHGIREIGRVLNKQKEVDYLVVDSIVEARQLRDDGVRKPILILGYVSQSATRLLAGVSNCVLAVNSIEQAFFLARSVSFPLRVHIKVDTGMNRQGVAVGELRQTLEVLRKHRHIKIEGMLSHLADADNIISGAHTIGQLALWKMAVAVFRDYVPHGGVLHFAATAGSAFSNVAYSNMIRAGIGLYGFDVTGDRRLGVKPILSFYAKVVHIKRIKAGERIGYNFTFTAAHDMMLAIIPCGYYEGIPRALSNKGVVYYHHVPLPIVGRVSMNLTVVDATMVRDRIKIEDEVEIFSADHTRSNSITRAAELADTIPYEILARLAPGIRRVVE